MCWNVKGLLGLASLPLHGFHATNYGVPQPRRFVHTRPCVLSQFGGTAPLQVGTAPERQLQSALRDDGSLHLDGCQDDGPFLILGP